MTKKELSIFDYNHPHHDTVYNAHEEIYWAYKDLELEPDYDETEVDAILYLSNGKLTLEYYQHSFNKEHEEGTHIFKFRLSEGFDEMTQEENDLVKVHMNQDDDSQPGGTWDIWLGDLWYYQPYCC